ncbi:MAG: hypothetical protein FD123_176 [Bacteroidetes bacterium]|nr:MAG: hypothetical protein FD123_176 [Bacteroidota bacterium]
MKVNRCNYCSCFCCIGGSGFTHQASAAAAGRERNDREEQQCRDFNKNERGIFHKTIFVSIYKIRASRVAHGSITRRIFVRQKNSEILYKSMTEPSTIMMIRYEALRVNMISTAHSATKSSR